MKEKVYCCNCKYFYGFTSPNSQKTCLAKCFTRSTPIVPKEIFNQDGELLGTRNPEEVNRNNDCPDYKRKWWKVWV